VVRRTGRPLVIADASSDPGHAADPFVVAARCRSIAAIPIRRKDAVTGLVVLENRMIAGAFTPQLVGLTQALVAQAAISLDNAILYDDLSALNRELEARVEDRTSALTLANQKLRDAAAERERIETELRLAQKLESVGRLAAGVAHEINTPIQYVSDSISFVRDVLPSLAGAIGRYRDLVAAVGGGGDVAAAALAARTTDEASDLDYTLANVPEALDAALEGLGRVATIVRAMKEFGQPNRDERAMVDLNRAIESTLIIAANDCKYVASVETDLAPLPPVRCNSGEINQAVLNLMINAAHAIHDVVGESGAKGKIVVRTRRDGGEVEIAISDTGGGIPSAIRDKIYDPFFTTKEVGRGTGQGLAIARSVVVDKHGGSLRFDSEPGKGTTFFLRLPIGEAPQAAPAAEPRWRGRSQRSSRAG
jgi:signal transduction histidine kinase